MGPYPTGQGSPTLAWSEEWQDSTGETGAFQKPAPHALLNFFPQTHDERFLSSLPPKMMLLGWKNGEKEGIVIQPELPDGKCDTVRNVKPLRESHVMYTNKGCKNEIYKSQRNNNG